MSDKQVIAYYVDVNPLRPLSHCDFLRLKFTELTCGEELLDFFLTPIAA